MQQQQGKKQHDLFSRKHYWYKGEKKVNPTLQYFTEDKCGIRMNEGKTQSHTNTDRAQSNKPITTFPSSLIIAKGREGEMEKKTGKI